MNGQNGSGICPKFIDREPGWSNLTEKLTNYICGYGCAQAEYIPMYGNGHLPGTHCMVGVARMGMKWNPQNEL